MIKNFLNIKNRHLKKKSSKEAKTNQLYKKISLVYNIKLIKLSLNELNLIAKTRYIKGYKSISKERLLIALNVSKLVESEKSCDDARIKNVQKGF